MTKLQEQKIRKYISKIVKKTLNEAVWDWNPRDGEHDENDKTNLEMNFDTLNSLGRRKKYLKLAKQLSNEYLEYAKWVVKNNIINSSAIKNFILWTKEETPKMKIYKQALDDFASTGHSSSERNKIKDAVNQQTNYIENVKKGDIAYKRFVGWAKKNKKNAASGSVFAQWIIDTNPVPEILASAYEKLKDISKNNWKQVKNSMQDKLGYEPV